jgi:hypothetical protein
MKTRISFVLLALAVSACSGFFQLPMSARKWLGDILTTLEDEQTFSLHNMVRGEECNRVCRKNDVKVCRFHFMMKYFQVLGG